MAAQATAATGQNVVMWAGDQIALRFEIRGADGAPVALPGAVGHWYLEENDGTVLVHRTGAGVTLAEADGVTSLNVELLEADTAGRSGSFKHRARVRDGDGRLLTIAVGVLQIKASPETAA